jgi:hypothetical protein
VSVGSGVDLFSNFKSLSCTVSYCVERHRLVPHCATQHYPILFCQF